MGTRWYFHFHDLLMKSFIVHFSGFSASIYWANFPQSYLRKVHRGGQEPLEQIVIHHTQPQSLFHPRSRNYFLRIFVHLLRFCADGRANIGELRRSQDSKIHRSPSTIEVLDRKAPQESMEEREHKGWLESDEKNYNWEAA